MVVFYDYTYAFFKFSNCIPRIDVYGKVPALSNLETGIAFDTRSAEVKALSLLESSDIAHSPTFSAEKVLSAMPLDAQDPHHTSNKKESRTSFETADSIVSVANPVAGQSVAIGTAQDKDITLYNVQRDQSTDAMEDANSYSSSEASPSGKVLGAPSSESRISTQDQTTCIKDQCQPVSRISSQGQQLNDDDDCFSVESIASLLHSHRSTASSIHQRSIISENNSTSTSSNSNVNKSGSMASASSVTKSLYSRLSSLVSKSSAAAAEKSHEALTSSPPTSSFRGPIMMKGQQRISHGIVVHPSPLSNAFSIPEVSNSCSTVGDSSTNGGTSRTVGEMELGGSCNMNISLSKGKGSIKHGIAKGPSLDTLPEQGGGAMTEENNGDGKDHYVTLASLRAVFNAE